MSVSMLVQKRDSIVRSESIGRFRIETESIGVNETNGLQMTVDKSRSVQIFSIIKQHHLLVVNVHRMMDHR
jgi:hypothetical protein